MKEIRDAGRYLCVSVRKGISVWCSEPTCPWALLQILTVLNECTLLEELLTFGGPSLCLWECDGRDTEQGGPWVLHSRLHSSWQAPDTNTSPACSVDKDNCSISEEKKPSPVEVSSRGIPSWDSQCGWAPVPCDRVWRCHPGAAQVLQQEQSGFLRVLQRIEWFCLAEMQRFPYSPCSCCRTWRASRACADVTSVILNEYFMFRALVTVCQTVQGLAQSCLLKWWACGLDALGNMPLCGFTAKIQPDWFS